MSRNTWRLHNISHLGGKSGDSKEVGHTSKLYDCVGSLGPDNSRGIRKACPRKILEEGLEFYELRRLLLELLSHTKHKKLVTPHLSC